MTDVLCPAREHARQRLHLPTPLASALTLPAITSHHTSSTQINLSDISQFSALALAASSFPNASNYVAKTYSFFKN